MARSWSQLPLMKHITQETSIQRSLSLSPIPSSPPSLPPPGLPQFSVNHSSQTNTKICHKRISNDHTNTSSFDNGTNFTNAVIRWLSLQSGWFTASDFSAEKHRLSPLYVYVGPGQKSEPNLSDIDQIVPDTPYTLKSPAL